MKNNSKEFFIEKLREVDWSDVTWSNDVESSFENFKRLFLSVIDSLAPEKEVRLKQRTEPWFNSEISEAISERDNWLRLLNNSKWNPSTLSINITETGHKFLLPMQKETFSEIK